jgi:hypothetical protein
MKATISYSVLLLVAFLSLPMSADAFSRRSHSSEVAKSQAITPSNNQTTGDVSAQAVPEPPVLLLMSIGIAVFALGVSFKAFRKHA